jgi:hypothetical protein
MSMTLLEMAKMQTDPLKQGIIEVFPAETPVLQYLPFKNIAGNSYRYNIEETLPGIAWRAVGGSYTESTGVVNPQTESLFILGGVAYTDRALVLTQGNGPDLRAHSAKGKAKAAALDFTKAFFKGDNATDMNQPDGLQQRLTGDQLIAQGSTSGGDTLTLPKVDELIDAVVGGPDVLFMNKTLRRKINTLMRAAGQATETVSDVFGRQIPAYAGVPIGIIENDSTDTAILGFTEANPGGGSNVGTSIYAVRFGVDEYVCGLQTKEGVDVEDLGLVGVSYQTLVEWLCGMAVFHPRSAARLYGIKNA